MNLFVSKTSSWLGLAFPFLLMNFSSPLSFIPCEKTADEIAYSTKHWPQILRPAFGPPKKFVQLYWFQNSGKLFYEWMKSKSLEKTMHSNKNRAFCLTTGTTEPAMIGERSIAKKGREHQPCRIPRLNKGWTAYPLLNPLALMTEERHRSLRTLRLQSENVWWRGKR